jgi:hypothetical protein
MYGVDRNSRSSEIQAQILTELTSLDNSVLRAQSGAGIPARKDFFHLSGEKPVTGMEYLNWRELLRYGGARSRRRDRILMDGQVRNTNSETISATENPSALYNTIHRELLACLRVADLYRQQYAKPTEAAGRSDALTATLDRVDEAVATIYATARLPIQAGN